MLQAQYKTVTVKRSDLSLENQGSAAAAGGRTPAYAGGAPATPMHPGGHPAARHACHDFVAKDAACLHSAASCVGHCSTRRVGVRDASVADANGLPSDTHLATDQGSCAAFILLTASLRMHCRRQDADASGRGDADARVGQPDADAPGRDAAARAGDPQLGPHQVRSLLQQPAQWMGSSTAAPCCFTCVLPRHQLFLLSNQHCLSGQGRIQGERSGLGTAWGQIQGRVCDRTHP